MTDTPTNRLCRLEARSLEGQDPRCKAAAPSKACLVNPNQAPGRTPNARSGTVQRRHR